MTTTPTVTVSTMTSASRERAWQDVTTPADISGWSKARMDAKDTRFECEFEAVYEVFEPHKALTLLMGDGRRGHTTFEAVAPSRRM